MDFLCLRREGIQTARDAVIKACTEAHDEVGLVHRPIGLIGAVHAQHAEPSLTRGRIGAKAHQCGGNRRAGDAGELPQDLACGRTRIDDATARVKDRAFGSGKHLDCRFDQLDVALYLGAIARMVDGAGLFVRRGGDLHVLWNVDDNRAGTPRRRDVERFVDHVTQRLRRLHQIVMLGAVARDANGIGFLKRV